MVGVEGEVAKTKRGEPSGNMRGLWRWPGWPVLLSALALVLLLWDAHVFVALRYGRSFLSLVFWQQLATTSVGAMLALAIGWGLYRHRQKTHQAETSLATDREALNLLRSLYQHLERDVAVLEKLAAAEELSQLRFGRLRTVFLEMAARRLLDLRGNVELVRLMADVLHLHHALNRSLDAHWQVYYGSAALSMRSVMMEELRQNISLLARRHLLRTAHLLADVRQEIEALEARAGL